MSNDSLLMTGCHEEDYELGTYSRDAQILRIDDMYDGLPITHYTR